MSFKEFVDQNITVASEVLKERGHFAPQAVTCDEDGRWSIMVLAMNKEKWNVAIRNLVRKFKAKYVVLISETWFAEVEKPDEMVLPVHNNPFRKEALALTAYAKSGEEDLVMIPFDHVDPKTIKMENPKRDSKFVSNVFENPWVVTK